MHPNAAAKVGVPPAPCLRVISMFMLAERLSALLLVSQQYDTRRARFTCAVHVFLAGTACVLKRIGAVAKDTGTN